MLAAVKRVVKEAAGRRLLPTEIALQFSLVPGVKVRALRERLKRHARTRIEPEEMRQICEAPDRQRLVGKMHAALLSTLASSALRADELVRLTTQQIHQRGPGYYLLVVGKTDTLEREAHLSVEAYARIQEWLDARAAYGLSSSFLFTSFTTRASIPTVSPISTTGVWKLVQRYAKACGLHHIKTHDLRRFVGTQLAATDIRKAQKALGHRSIETTARHYILDELEIGLTDHLY